MSTEKRNLIAKSLVNVFFGIIIALFSYGASLIEGDYPIYGLATIFVNVFTYIMIAAILYSVWSTIRVIIITLAQNSHIQKKEYPNLSIAKIMMNKNYKRSIYAKFILTFSLLLILFFRGSIISIGLITFLMIVTIIADESIDYRIKKGFYGNNEYEARQIIEFILNNSDHIDFTDGKGGMKRIITTDDLELINDKIKNTVPVDLKGI
jgi:hypothetical protein